jgi:Reverse transcriptase (RNA-dependent DNA polymerase)
VYSYQLRDKKPDARHGLFRESDVIDVPFLKGGTISRKLDPFESWYNAWPDFDRATKRAFEAEGYNYLAVSDISAYFENVQLPILRDRLLTLLNGESKIVTLLLTFLETWSIRTVDGRHHWRGIPQGTQIGSFLGNIFLIPLDEAFKTFCAAHDVKYFRYMDDVKVFAKDISIARRAIMTMDRLLRRLHLNAQSAKTLSLREQPNSEITHALVDERLTETQAILDDLKNNKPVDDVERKRLIAELDKLGRQRPKSPTEQPIYGARRALKDMSLRTFRRLITAYIALDDHKFVARLFDEIERNPDYRLTRKLVSSARRFPRKRQIGSRVTGFLKSPLNIFPHQEAELLWAVRYLVSVPTEIIEHCKRQLLDENADFYVRVQCARLLSRCRLDQKFLGRCHKIFSDENNSLVQASLVALLTQLPRYDANKMLETSQFHPNDIIRNTAIMLINVRDDFDEARNKLKHIFREFAVFYDYVPLLYAMAASDTFDILQELRSRLPDRRRTPALGDLEHVVADLLLRIDRAIEPEVPRQRYGRAASTRRVSATSGNPLDVSDATELTGRSSSAD